MSLDQFARFEAVMQQLDAPIVYTETMIKMMMAQFKVSIYRRSYLGINLFTYILEKGADVNGSIELVDGKTVGPLYIAVVYYQGTLVTVNNNTVLLLISLLGYSLFTTGIITYSFFLLLLISFSLPFLLF